jgi:hypothetical protein
MLLPETIEMAQLGDAADALPDEEVTARNLMFQFQPP